jgi:predicted phosphodiesterase
MRYAILGDIHANLEGLQTILEDAKKEKCSHYCCVGDLVGYNPNPKECMDIVRDMNMPCVKGNHDEYASVEDDCVGFRPMAAEAIRWTRNQLNDDDKKFLRTMKFVRYVENFTIVHSTLDMPQKWGYVMDKLAAAASFSYQNTAVCFFGHTHVPLAFVRDSVVKGGTYETIHIEPGKKYFINVGSVGQPRDGNPMAAYCVYDLVTNTVVLKRLEYNLKLTQKKIFEAGLPERCATRLEIGK